MPLTDPVTSSAFDVLERNIQDTDKFVNQATGTFTNRVGKEIKPIPVIEAEANAAVISLGWHQVGLFADGFTYTLQNDIAKDTAGDWYRWNGTLPKVVTAGTLSSSDADFVKIDYKSHAELSDRNPADGSAHNANDIGKNGGGSVQDFIDAQYTTVAELATGKFQAGQYVRLTDRAMGLFLLQPGGAVNGTSILDAGNSNTATYHLNSGVADVKQLGGKTGVDSTSSFVTACTLSNQVDLPDDDIYEINFDTTSGNNSLVTYSNEEHVVITGKAATIKDVSTYGVDFLTNIIKFVNCKNIYCEVNCDATPLADITAPYPLGIGYNGSAFLYLEGNCENVEVVGSHKNVRYGVRQGGYANPSLGGANNITVKTKCFQVGYPVALYGASNIDLDIDSNVQHRAAYLTGCRHVRGTVAQAGFTYAAIGVLIADALITASAVDADRRSYGGDDIKINVVDRGTTGTQSNRASAGIAGAWKAPNTKFNDIEINLNVKCNNGNRTLAGFRLENTVGWYPTNEFNKIKVTGVIDRTDQTLGGSQWADISIVGIESGEVGPYPNSPKFNGIDLDELQVLNGVVTGNISRIETPNAIGVISARAAKMGGVTFLINAPSAIVDLTNALFASVAGAIYPTVDITGSDGYRVNADGTVDQWMLVNYNVTANTDQTFNFPKAFRVSALSASVDVTGITGRTWSINGLSRTGITLRCSATSVSFYVRVIGQ